jgi:phage tail tape-measure protein
VAYGWRPNTANVYLSHARRAMRGKLEALGVPLRAPTAGHTAAAGGSARRPVALAGAVPLVYAVAPARRRLIVGRAWSEPLPLAA